jgi:hypothetical protein
MVRAILLANHTGWFELRSQASEFAHRTVANPYENSSILVREEYSIAVMAHSFCLWGG